MPQLNVYITCWQGLSETQVYPTDYRRKLP